MLQFIFNLELAPTHVGDQPLSPFERYVIAALHHLEKQMSDTQAALARLTATDQALSAKVETLVTGVTSLIEAVSNEPTAISEAVKKALEEAGADDKAVAAAVDAAEAGEQALLDKISALGDQVDAVATHEPPPLEEEPAPEPAAPEPQPVVVNAPAPITGTAGTPVSGQFSASGGTGPYTFACDGALGDFQVTEDGFYAMNPSSPMTGSVNITATDSEGEASEPVTVSISISPAA